MVRADLQEHGPSSPALSFPGPSSPAPVPAPPSRTRSPGPTTPSLSFLISFFRSASYFSFWLTLAALWAAGRRECRRQWFWLPDGPLQGKTPVSLRAGDSGGPTPMPTKPPQSGFSKVLTTWTGRAPPGPSQGSQPCPVLYPWRCTWILGPAPVPSAKYLQIAPASDTFLRQRVNHLAGGKETECPARQQAPRRRVLSASARRAPDRKPTVPWSLRLSAIFPALRTRSLHTLLETDAAGRGRGGTHAYSRLMRATNERDYRVCGWRREEVVAIW